VRARAPHHRPLAPTAMSTSALPALDALLRQSAKRTYDIFAACPDEGARDDEKRLVAYGSALVKQGLTDRLQRAYKTRNQNQR
jgi:hypothetical protein